MLQQMRTFARSWVVSIFLLGLALSFGLWGIGDIFRGGAADTSLATVGDFKITPEAFQQEYRNALKRMSRQAGHDITPEEAHAHGIDKKILENQISDAALAQAADKYGVIASDEQVSSYVRAIQPFHNTLGVFDHATMVQVLQQNNLSENQFIGLVRSDLTRDQLVSTAGRGTVIPAGYGKLFFAYVNEHRAAEYVRVSPQSVSGIPTPTDAELGAYLKAHAAEFSTPEYRDITYLSVAPDDVASQVKVSDAELKQRYDQQKDEYQIPEKRDVEQITFPDQASAKAVKAKIDAGTSFDDAAKSLGKSPTDISLGTLVQADLGPDRGPATFALPSGGTTQPVKFTFGWVLLHVTKITPGVNKSFDDVKETLRKQAFDQLAAAKITDISNAFDDARAGGASFTDAATRVGMKSARIPAVDIRTGLAPDGSKTGLPTAPEFQSQLARADIGEEGDPFTASDAHTYAIKVNGVTPSKLRPLDNVRAQVAAAWTEDQRRQRLAALASELAHKADADHSLNAVAAQVHASVQNTGAISRQEQNPSLSPMVVSRIFAATPGTSIAAPDGDGFIIARVTGVVHPPMPMDDPMARRFSGAIAEQAGNDAAEGLAGAWRDRLGVKINQALVDRAAGNGS